MLTFLGIRGFNGATTFQPWKCGAARIRDRFVACFNGATTFQPWKCEQKTSVVQDWQGLQWGHDFSAVEMPNVDGTTYRPPALQWGHDFSAVEISP